MWNLKKKLHSVAGRSIVIPGDLHSPPPAWRLATLGDEEAGKGERLQGFQERERGGHVMPSGFPLVPTWPRGRFPDGPQGSWAEAFTYPARVAVLLAEISRCGWEVCEARGLIEIAEGAFFSSSISFYFLMPHSSRAN